MLPLILDLTNSKPVKLDAVGGTILSKSEDIANVRIEFESGCVANITASRVSFKSLRRTRVFASDSFISLDYEKKYALVVKKSPDLDLSEMDLSSIDTSDSAMMQKLFMNDLLHIREIKLDEYEPLRKELEAFVECVRTGSESLVPSGHGLRAMRLATEILTGIKGKVW